MKCEERGYHNWEVIATNGTLPHQEVELKCDDCGCEFNVPFEYDGE